MASVARNWKRTRLCGCGECRFYPPTEQGCPMEKSPDAKWLFASEKKAANEDRDDAVVEIQNAEEEASRYEYEPETIYG